MRGKPVPVLQNWSNPMNFVLRPGHAPLAQWRQIYHGANVRLDDSAQAAVLRSGNY